MKISQVPRDRMSPMGRWIMEYIDTHQISMSALAVQCGLSPGALRYLIIEPYRKPTLETCLKLAQGTGTPVEELLAIGNLSDAVPAQDHQRELQPGRWELLAIFDALLPEKQRILLGIARVFGESNPRPVKEVLPAIGK